MVRERALLLHNWTGLELAEIADVRQVVRDVLSTSICPSNGTIARKFQKRYPNTRYQLLFNMHLNAAPPQRHSAPALYHQIAVHNHSLNDKYYPKYKPTSLHEPGDEGWGDDVSHYYVLENFLKLDPEQILWLKQNCPTKAHVEAYIHDLGEWFDNNGETLRQTLEFVLVERGVDVDEFWNRIHEEELGVAIDGS